MVPIINEQTEAMGEEQEEVVVTMEGQAASTSPSSSSSRLSKPLIGWGTLLLVTTAGMYSLPPWIPSLLGAVLVAAIQHHHL